MNSMNDIKNLEPGYDIPAAIGMDESEIQTPCLVIDLDAFEQNVEVMRAYCEQTGMRHRVHGKMHKSVDVAKYQIDKGDACGVCCQKVSEAEVFARAGVKDVLVSNQVRDPAKIDRLARLPKLGARTLCCIDDLDNVDDLSAAAVKHGTQIEVLVEIDCGAGRCGVSAGQPVVDIALAVDAAAGLKFAGIQAYQGAMQHMQSFEDRREKIDIAVAMVKQSVDMLKEQGLECDIVGGGGTGSYYFEGSSGVYNELQCGSYAFMDADYQTIHDESGERISEFGNALFILSSIMSHVHRFVHLAVNTMAHTGLLTIRTHHLHILFKCIQIDHQTRGLYLRLIHADCCRDIVSRLKIFYIVHAIHSFTPVIKVIIASSRAVCLDRHCPR